MIEINIRNRPLEIRDDVYIFEKDAMYYTIYRFDKDGNIIEERMKREETYGTVIKPSFTAPHEIARGIAQGFFDYLSERGLASESESYTKGKLEATQEHLKDTRKLLKLDK